MGRSHWTLVLPAVVVVLTGASACGSADPDPVAPVAQSVSPTAATAAPTTASKPQPVPNGTYFTTATRERAKAAGFDDALIEEAYGPDGTLEIVLRLQNGLWTQLADYDGAALDLGDAGSYRFEADQMVMTSTSTGCPGCVGVMDVTFDGRQLTLQYADRTAHTSTERLMVEHTYTLKG